MKLLAKYNRLNIIATVIVLLVGGICYYFILHFVLLKQLDNDLKIEEQEIRDYVYENKALPNAANYKDQEIHFEETVIPIKRKFESLDVYMGKHDEFNTNRVLFFSMNISSKNYKISISKSQQETEDLIQLIVSITLALVALLLFILFIINRFVFNKLWHPFHNTINELKKFDVSSNNTLKLHHSNINEFNDLNNAVAKMSHRVVKDYESLKSFTENASHEIQTPLAIIQSKMELLVQGENFTSVQLKNIQTINDEISRLSKLNKSLLLLTKIDNNQFIETEKIELSNILNKQLNNYEELFEAKNIIVTKKLEDSSAILMNETMAEILITNLITNAIKHNINNGAINIVLNKKQLIINNTGKKLTTNTVDLFERFKKEKPESDSLGLGLSIVKKICERYRFTVNYDYANSLHSIEITFRE
jgi:signal transduction histidine kinase